MGSWSEERRAGTEEVLLTYPVSVAAVAGGKFLASWLLAFLMTAIATLSAALTVAALGDLDWNTVWVGLLGAAFLLAAYVAVAQCLSAASGEQLVAFLLGALALGIAWSLPLFVRILPGELAGALEAASPTQHFLGSAARGVVDLADLVYFALVAAAALGINVLLVEGRRCRR